MEKDIDQPLLHINLLGNPKLKFGNNAPLQLQKRLLALLVYITIEQQMVERSKLTLLFWSNVLDEPSRSSLRTGLSKLRKILGDYVHSTRQAVGLNWEKPILVDAFELHTALTSEPIDFKKIDAAIARYRGDFLTGFELKDAPEFNSWCAEQQERFQQLAFEAFNKLIEDSEKKKNYDRAIQYAQQMLNLDKWQEESHYKLIYLYGLQGNRAAALKQYEKCKDTLVKTLEIEPSEALENLVAQIKLGELEQLNEPLPIKTDSSSPTYSKDFTLPDFLKEEAPIVKQELFLGRTEELNRLNGLLESICSGKGQVQFILGSAGKGKSYLLQKFAKEAQKAHPDLLVLTGYCNQQVGAGDPYLPFRYILLLLLGDVEAEWRGGLISTAQAQLLWKAMEQTVPQVAKHAPDLISSFITGTPLIDRLVAAGLNKELWFEEVSQLASEKPLGTLEQIRIISLYANALQAIAETRPILLILEDLHWVDASSATLFNYLSKQVPKSNILLIGSYRPSHVLADKSQHPILEISKELKRTYGDIEINLEEQRVEKEREFVNAYLDSEPNELDNKFREVFFKHTQGHALFTAELLNTLKDKGDLYQQEGKWFAKDDLNWQTLPAKVEGVIEMRIGRLPNEQRRLLNIASVQGETFIGEVIAQVQKQNEREVIYTLSEEIDKRHQLVQSQRMERLNQQRLSHYRFRHNLFQRYMYDDLAETERAYLHEDIALALETMYGEEANSIATQLAWHFEKAGNIEKTFQYLLVTGQQAQVLGSSKEAAIHYERGLSLFNQLPASPELLPVELGLQAGLGMALAPVEGFQSENVRIALERALELCRQIGPNPQLMPIYAGLAYYSGSNNNVSMHVALERASEFKLIAQKQEDLAHLATAEALLVTLHCIIGNNNTAIELGHLVLGYINFDQASHENMIRYYSQDQRVLLTTMLAWALCFKGKLKEAKALMAKEPLPNFRHAASRAMFLSVLASNYQFMNDLTKTETITKELLKLANEYGYSFWEAWGLVCHGWVLAQLGKVDAGVAQMQQGLNIARMSGGFPMGSYLLGTLAEGLSLKHEYNEALNVLEEAFDYCNKKDEFFHLSQLNCLKAKCLQKLGAEDIEVEKYFKQAIDVAKQQGTPMLELRASLSLARYWQANNKKRRKLHSLLTETIRTYNSYSRCR